MATEPAHNALARLSLTSICSHSSLLSLHVHRQSCVVSPSPHVHMNKARTIADASKVITRLSIIACKLRIASTGSSVLVVHGCPKAKQKNAKQPVKQAMSSLSHLLWTFHTHTHTHKYMYKKSRRKKKQKHSSVQGQVTEGNDKKSRHKSKRTLTFFFSSSSSCSKI